MAMTLRLTESQEIELDKVQGATHKATKSQAVLTAVMQYRSMQEKIKTQEAKILELQREVQRLGSAISQYKSAHSAIMDIKL
ncbi:alpha-D-ribose 1-methylphosphonate 5-triphosphate synthase subunit PhnG [Rheinheimera pacifica]|uniref:hypothetical protein n=1 Tax=Rheinheimera pacifica TaxID=173990 RepID=UPI00216725E0|nr:hypothetical protein [Rheinheimera pacifica]MCS4309685.1 alpha-D-ribose 1-methylphosphonate 5-triphosphate synthase subunit PhnG [Rheinheimera pacifica]